MRYLLFGGEDYYPAGGWDDLRATADDYAEILTVADGFAEFDDWQQVVRLADVTAMERRCRGGGLEWTCRVPHPQSGRIVPPPPPVTDPDLDATVEVNDPDGYYTALAQRVRSENMEAG